ncbi:MAG: hypothetical protein NZT92_16900, partial [Abditibacteriales bacterium]|nr:hypothetical protein [Abditibacteriales bacterium]
PPRPTPPPAPRGAPRPAGRRPARAGREEIVLWDLATGRAVRRMEGHTGGVSSVAFSPDGQHLASGSWDGTIRIWRVE